MLFGGFLAGIEGERTESEFSSYNQHLIYRDLCKVSKIDKNFRNTLAF